MDQLGLQRRLEETKIGTALAGANDLLYAAFATHEGIGHAWHCCCHRLPAWLGSHEGAVPNSLIEFGLSPQAWAVESQGCSKLVLLRQVLEILGLRLLLRKEEACRLWNRR